MTMHAFKKTAIAVMTLAALFSAQQVFAKTVPVTMTAMEVDVQTNGKLVGGEDTMAAWTFDGAISGKFIRVEEGDTVDFTLINPAENKNDHAMDFHAALVNVLDEFAPVKPGQSKHFKFEAKTPGLFMYHCGASPMVQHIARGMYGMILVEPKDKKNYPKADREYVLMQQQYFPDVENYGAMLGDANAWKGSLVNGKVLHYDPVHDPKGDHDVLEAKPGERVRIYYGNANINLPVALHPIASVWDRVYINGNPKNQLQDIQTYNMGVFEADTFDLVTPKDKEVAGIAIVDHSMNAALRGAITVLVSKKDANPNKGKGEMIILK
jgi:nitrite reductase (NO-forming)